jgi:amino acid adenylation domain-containing protein
LIGAFINTLPLRGDLAGDPTWRRLLARTRETAVASYALQDLPFEKLVEELKPPRDLARPPLFQVLLAQQNPRAGDLAMQGLTLSPLGQEPATAKLELVLTFADEMAVGHLEYNADLFDRSTAERMLGHLEVLLAGAAADPDRRLSELPLLTATEREQLARWNDTGAAIPAGCLHELVAAQAARTPDATAVSCGASGESLTYAGLLDRAGRLARELSRLGIGPGTLVGLAAGRSPDLVVALLSILAAGGAYLPLDPSYPAERLSMVLEDARPRVLITAQNLAGRFADLPGRPAHIVLLDEPRAAGAAEGLLAARTLPDNLAYVLFTSGSTGRPKGVAVTHRALLNFLAAMGRAPGLAAGAPLLAVTSLSFDIAGLEIWLPLLCGGCVEIATQDEAADGRLLAARLAASGARTMQATPSTWRMLLDTGWAGDRRLKALCGGEALPERLAADLRTRVGEVWNLYGPTETTVWSTAERLSGSGPVSIGRPIASTQIHIVDPQGAPLPVGTPGELWIGGAGLARGYLGRPDLTAERFVPDGLGGAPGARLYRTGDLARWRADGRLEHLGRIDHQVKVRGVRIEPGEIESALERHAAVARAIVGVRESAGGEAALAAYVVPAGEAPAPAALREHLRKLLPAAMVPSLWTFLAELPLTPNGKVDRRALPRPERAGAPPVGREVPRSEVERRIAAIWRELLGSEEIGVDDDFFDLGGHSLLAVRVLSRAHQTFGIDLPLRALFEEPTIAGLAARIERARSRDEGRSQPPPLAPVPRDPAVRLPLSFSQQRLWFLQRLEPASAQYNLPTALRLTGPLRAEALTAALREILRRHESLRTTFGSVEGVPFQRVSPAEVCSLFHLPVVDLEALSPAGREREAEKLARGAARRPFDLEQGPVLHAQLLRLSAGDHVLLATMHHIASDGWSMGILTRELSALYQAARAGAPSPLPELPIQYADFALWQRRWLTGEALERELSYWRERLAGAPPSLDLPTDRPRPALQSFRGAQHPFSLPADLSAALAALGRREGTTLFMTLLVCFQALLARCTGQTDLSVGSPMAGRDRLEVEELIGFFVNTLVLRTDLAGDPTFRTLLARVRETALDAHLHQDVPFEKLVEELRPQRDLSRSPLFQVMLILQNAPQESLEIPGLTLRPLRTESGASKFDLTLSLTEGPQSLRGSLQYSSDLFDGTTMLRLLERFQILLAGVVADPGQRLSELTLSSEPERAQIAREWNDTAVAQRGPECLPQMFARQAAQTPDAPAVVWGETVLSYAELDARSDRLARHLRRLGVGPERLVGVLLERAPEMVVVLLGIAKAEGAYLPLDPAYPAERLATLLEDSGASLVLTQESLRASLPPGRVQVLSVDGDTAVWAAESPALAASEIRSAQLAYALYTSGSTGRPKGVQVTHGALANFLLAMQERPGLHAEDALLAVTPLSFDIAGLEIFLPLVTGARVLLASREDIRDGLRLKKLLERSGATVMQATPAIWRILLESGWTGDRRLKALCGGEALPERLAADLRTRVGEVWNLYGPTETTVWSAAERLSGPGPVSIGRPIASTQIHIVDPHGDPLPVGTPGELWIGGMGLARGYLDRPDLTAERFVPDGLGGAPGARLYRTGDLARWRADGRLEHLGRIDHQVKVRGVRIEPGEIESALERHAAVTRAIVGVRDSAGGEAALAAYVVSAGEAPAPAALREHLRKLLPEAMVPSLWTFLTELPLTPNGKVDRRALPQPDRAGGPPVGREVPRSEVERRIAAIWRELLGSEEIGVDDNFFDLGGHSLLLARVQSRLASELGREVAMVDLFIHSTVRSLAQFLGRDAAGAAGEDIAALLPLRPAADRREPVAVIGMAGRFPRAGDLEQLWQNLCDGVEAISFFSEEELAAAGVRRELLADPAYVRAAGVLEGADLFDAEMFGVPPREAEIIDPQQRILLECAWEALEQAGYAGTRRRVGVFAGTGHNTYLLRNVVSRPEIAGAVGGLSLTLASAPDFVATRISYKLGLTGPGVTVQTACSTSLVAIHLACQSLLAGDCEIALAGGAAVKASPLSGYLYRSDGILSPDGHCRAFDARAQGTVGGQGVGVVVLKRLADALADGDTVHAVILGSAINNDGSTKAGFTAPSPEGQAAAIREARLRAGIDPASIGYVEAHGTATALGDPIEVAALTRAFGPDPRPGSCALGSIKTNIGHLDAAAGVAGFLKALLAVERGTIPPSLHFEQPNPEIDFASGPFYVNTRLTPWPEDRRPRRAGVSSFGLGGTNAHAILEEPPQAEPSGASRPWQVLTLSARSATALESATDALAAHLKASSGLSPAQGLADVAHTLWVGRRAFRWRRAVLAASTEEAAAALSSRDPRRVFTAEHEAGDRPIAFLLPGVGEQYAGMAAGLYAAEPVFRREIDRCAELLIPDLGLDLRELIARPAAADGGTEASLRDLLRPRGEAAGPLDRTAVAQPAMFALGWALAQLWISWGIRPSALLGYSLGEYTAACLAGVMSLADGLTLVARRARLIAELPAGGMLAVPLPEEALRPELGPALSLAAVNGPSTCVVSGPAEEIAALASRLAEREIPSRRLRTSHAFHARTLEPIAGPLRELLRGIELKPPQIPYLSNVTGTWIEPDRAVDPDYWVEHLLGTVRFGDAITELWREPARILLELGPGLSLGSLALQQLPDDLGDRIALPSLRHELERQDDQALLLSTLARLWLAGVEVDASLLYAGERRWRVPLPTTPFERQRFWIDRVEGEPAATARPAGKIPDVADWFHAPTWRRSTALATEPRDSARRWLLFLDAHGLGERLAARLRAAGHHIAEVRPGRSFARLGEHRFAVDPASDADFERLLTEIGEAPDEVVHAWSLSLPDGEPDLVRFDAAQEAGFYSLICLTRALAGRLPGRKLRISIVANGLCQVERSDALHPEKATLQGPLKVIPQEHPEIACRAIDVDLREIEAGLEERLLAELERKDGEPLVALRGRHRWAPDFEAVRLDLEPGFPLPLRDGGTYLVTGGLGGIGLAVAGWLARTVHARLALVGRTPLPAAATDEETARRLREVQALEAAGAEVLAIAADVADEAAMREAVARIRQRFGRIDGVFHAAGVPGGGLLQLKSREASARILAPKTRGTLILESVLRDEPPSLVVLFSSINAVTGGIGQVDYCAANAFLDAFAGHCAARGARTVAVDWCEWQWDRWSGAGLADPMALAELRRQRATYGMSFDEGMEALRRILASGLPQVVVSTRGLRKDLDHHRTLTHVLEVLARTPERQRVDGRQRPRAGTPYVAPRSETEVRIASVWRELLGIEPIGAHDNFFQLGGSSLLGLEVIWRLSRELGLQIPLRALFEAPTVSELAALVELGEDPRSVVLAAPEIRPAQAQKAELLAQLDDLSDEEVGALLISMMAEEAMADEAEEAQP